MFRRIAMGLALAAVSAPANAEWHRAESQNFIIYADDKARDIREFAVMLEKFHVSLAHLTKRQVRVPSPSNKLVIFAVGTTSDVKSLYEGDNRYVAGFYIARAGDSVAFVPDVKHRSKRLDFSMTTLLHEYTHHFLISTSRFAMPRWINEGAAEFYSSASFEKDGRVWIGRPAIHRAAELVFSEDVSIEELLDQNIYESRKSGKHDEFYGRSWALYHYLTFSESRSGQLEAYGRALEHKSSSLGLAKQIFGDLETLDNELERYLKSRSFTAFWVKPTPPDPHSIQIEELSDGLVAMMPVFIQLRRGTTRETATDLLESARTTAATFPEDGEVMAVLAEVEHVAGNNLRAISAAEKAISLDPSITSAYIQKGSAMFELAQEAHDQRDAYRDAFAPFRTLNQIENDHPIPLIFFFRQYTAQGIMPPDSARQAIERAAELAPFDGRLWIEVGIMKALEGKIEAAINSLLAVSSDPHGGEMARYAQAYIDAMNGAPEGEPFNLANVPPPLPPVEIPPISEEN